VLDRTQIANLETALVTARRMGAAIGILMANRKINETQALDALRVVSQNSHRQLRDIADDGLLTGMLPVE